jgi:hypothetical protein
LKIFDQIRVRVQGMPELCDAQNETGLGALLIDLSLYRAVTNLHNRSGAHCSSIRRMRTRGLQGSWP